MDRRWRVILLVMGATLVCMVAVALLYRQYDRTLVRTGNLMTWLRDAAAHPEWAVSAGRRCGDAPFIIPTDGYIGFLWDDTFRVGHRHQGLDIFSGRTVGQTPVLAAYPGYLRRLPDWKSSVIIRHPQDPLEPGRQIWTYYTHMAEAGGKSLIVSDFPAGTAEKYVDAGALLGFQGDYSGDPSNPVGVHLHFSIVKDDGEGNFLNELEIQNTMDPSAYLGMPLNATMNPGEIPACEN